MNQRTRVVIEQLVIVSYCNQTAEKETHIGQMTIQANLAMFR